MALMTTPSAEIGWPCPKFSLPAVDGKTYTRESFSNKDNKILLIAFLCNHCPYVQAIENRLIQLGHYCLEKNVGFLAISSNDVERYPEDSFEKMKERANSKDYSFPYAYDKTQEVAKTFGAVCTPDFFLFDQNHQLAYRGRLDDSWKDASQVKKTELKNAIDSLLKGEKPQTEQTPSMGCSIKWKNA